MGILCSPHLPTLQIQDPTNAYLVHQVSVSNGDHSFDARADGKHIYCFSNENWSSNTKEVSFNVHGVVYVPESEAPSDPLEQESTSTVSDKGRSGRLIFEFLSQSSNLPTS